MLSDGYVILASDLEAVSTTALASLISDNQTLPAVYWLNINFVNLVASSSATVSTRNIPIPDNYYIVEISVSTAIHTGLVNIILDNGDFIEPISLSKSVSASLDKFSRYFSAAHPLQLLSKGSDLGITAATTSASTGSTINVAIGLATFWRRD